MKEKFCLLKVGGIMGIGEVELQNEQKSFCLNQCTSIGFSLVSPWFIGQTINRGSPDLP